ncbi:MAG TPA: PIG-L family deacetylase [Blastocatellia bacterium]|nr:PIG-L family deacetylase [Blastocatellia bacterium]
MVILRRLRAVIRELLAARAEQGPYRFLVRRWDEISDIDLAVRVLGTEFFSSQMTPLPLPVEKLRSVLVIAPHQDDEVIGAGGTLLIASEAGVKIDVLYITDGAAKNPPYASSSVDSIRIRNQEAEEACLKMGANMHRLDISNLNPEPTLNHLDRLAEIIHTLKPQVVMAPWVLDSPAKHRLVNHLLWLVHKRSGLPDFEVWGYQVHNTLYPNGYVDITGVAEKKLEILRCFKSQNQFGQCYDHLAMGMAAWNARFLERSPDPRYVEVFFTLPVIELLRLIRSFYFNNLWATYRGDSRVIQGARAIHGAVTKGFQQNGRQSSIALVDRWEA